MSYFSTDYEFVTLNVRDFGAKGDGESDDTLFIQAAVMACPKQSRVLIPAGPTGSPLCFYGMTFPLSWMRELCCLLSQTGAVFPVFEGMVQSYDEKGEYNLGTWEAIPCVCSPLLLLV
mgnify:CR=1 FL=1